MARTKSSKQWLQAHFADPYVKLAQQKGYRSRAAFKLQEIQQKEGLIFSGMTVVDLGAAPGGWTQLLSLWLKGQGKIVAIDRLAMDQLPHVTFLQGDFTEASIIQALRAELGDAPVDLVLSDLAPNLSGNRSIDQPRVMYLVELAYDFAQTVLKPGGNFLVKVFEGQGTEAYKQVLKRSFDQVRVRKPQASRACSNEIYYLAKGFKG